MTASLWTIVNALMLVLFALAVVVQFNDPDPLLWIAVYGAAAVLCGLEIRRRAPLWAPVALSLTTLAWAGWIAFRVHDVTLGSLFAEWEMKDLRVEESREMYGLAIVGLWMLAIAAAAWTRAKRRETARA